MITEGMKGLEDRLELLFQHWTFHQALRRKANMYNLQNVELFFHDLISFGYRAACKRVWRILAFEPLRSVSCFALCSAPNWSWAPLKLSERFKLQLVCSGCAVLTGLSVLICNESWHAYGKNSFCFYYLWKTKLKTSILVKINQALYLGWCQKYWRSWWTWSFGVPRPAAVLLTGTACQLGPISHPHRNVCMASWVA